jgi:hypothetical protein
MAGMAFARDRKGGAVALRAGGRSTCDAGRSKDQGRAMVLQVDVALGFRSWRVSPGVRV